MPSYRIFKLSSRTGQREPGEWLDAADDDEAVKLALAGAGNRRCEIWLKTRLVAILAHDDAQTDGATMRKQRNPESDEERQGRLEMKARDRAAAQAADERAIDEMIRKNIRLHGA